MTFLLQPKQKPVLLDVNPEDGLHEQCNTLGPFRTRYISFGGLQILKRCHIRIDFPDLKNLLCFRVFRSKV